MGCDSVVTMRLWVKTAAFPPPGFAPSDTSVCQGDTLHLRVNAVPGAEFYLWSHAFSPPSTFIQIDTAIALPWTAPAGANVCVRVANTCAESLPVCRYFSTHHIPTQAVILGPDTACVDAISRFRIDALDGWRDCLWQVEGGAIVGQPSPSEVDIAWGKQAKTARLCATLKNECGAAQPGCQTIVLDAVPEPPSLQGDTLICTGSGPLFDYAAKSGDNTFDHQWYATGNGQVSAGQGTPFAQVYWRAPGGTLCVTAAGRCGVSVPHCLKVTAFEPSLAQVGPDADTCGQMLAMVAVAAPGLGEWTLSGGPPGSNPMFKKDKTAAQNTLIVDLPGLYSAVWTVTNGVCVDRDTLYLRFYDTPEIEAYTFDCDPVFENYRVQLSLRGGTPPYAVNGVNTGEKVFVSPVLPNHTPFRFDLVDSNGCTARPVEGVYACPCVSNAGQMSENPLVVCGSDSIVVQQPTGTVSDPNDTGLFVLHTVPSDSLGLVLAKNKTGVFRFQTGMVYQQQYYVSYVVGNAFDGMPDFSHPCLSVAKGQPIRFYQQPQAMAGLDANTCGLSGKLQAVAANGTGTWSLLEGPPGGKMLFSNGADSAQNTCTVDQYGIYRLSWSVTNGACTAIDTLNLGFFQDPQIATPLFECDSVAEHYRLLFQMIGGTAPFKVNGDPLNGETFTSPWIAKDQPYAYRVNDANDCAAPLLAGTHSCACLTDAGRMDSTLLAVCAADFALARLPAGAFLDPNDTDLFVLHTSGATTLGTVLAKNRDGRFGFLPGMAYNTTYYISYVAGNALNGEPDALHPCFSVAKGQPVVFSQKPQVSTGMDRDTCGLSVLAIATLDTGLGTWSSPANALMFEQGANAARNTITAAQPGEYEAVWEAVNGACTTSDTLHLRFFPSLRTGPVMVRCDSVSEHFQVSFDLNGGTPPFWVNGVALGGSAFQSAPLNSGTAYVFNTVDANGCYAAILSGNHSCPCLSGTARLPVDTLKTCEGDSAVARLLEQPILDPNDVGVFVLHTSGADTLGDIMAYNNSGAFGFRPGWLFHHTYYISYFVGNTLNGVPDWKHPCARVSKGQPLVYFQKPEADAGLDGDTCGLSISLNPKAVFGVGAWSVTAKPDEGVLSFAQTGTGSKATANKTGQYTAVWTVSNAACTVRDTATLRFFPIPWVGETNFFCDNVNERYTAVSTLYGGTTPYWVNGVPTSGSKFTSGPFDSGAPYIFQLTDANGCNAPPLSGTHTCTCGSHAGTMNTAILQVCKEDTVQVKTPADAQLDPNDAGVFVLHSAPGKVLGKIWAQSANGRFAFQAGMSHDSTYYLSFVVGNARNGLPDLGDVCLSVGTGQPLRFLPPPEASLTVEKVRCYGEKNGAISAVAKKGSPPVLYALNETPFTDRAVFGALSPGTYRIRTLDATGCEWVSAPLALDEPPKLDISLEKQLKVIQGDTLLVEAKILYPSAAIDTIVWRPLLDTFAAGLSWQRIAPLRPLTLSVSVVDTNGCTAQDQTQISVQKKRRIFVPNTVALQGGENANLTVFGGPETNEIVRFELFDRWGNLLYQRLRFPPGSPDPGWQKQLHPKKSMPLILIYRAIVSWKDGTEDIFHGDIFLIN